MSASRLGRPTQVGWAAVSSLSYLTPASYAEVTERCPCVISSHQLDELTIETVKSARWPTLRHPTGQVASLQSIGYMWLRQERFPHMVEKRVATQGR